MWKNSSSSISSNRNNAIYKRVFSTPTYSRTFEKTEYTLPKKTADCIKILVFWLDLLAIIFTFSWCVIQTEIAKVLIMGQALWVGGDSAG